MPVASDGWWWVAAGRPVPAEQGPIPGVGQDGVIVELPGSCKWQRSRR